MLADKTSDEQQPTPTGTRKSFTDKTPEELGEENATDEQNTPSQANIQEEEEESKVQKPEPEPAKINVEALVQQPPRPKRTVLDYQLLDELFQFLDQEDSELLPILCGYFNKIVTALLSKIKQKMLVYLLVERNGDVFNKLLNHLEHHSLAQLMIELMQLKIVSASAAPRDRFSSDFDKEENTEDGESQIEDEK